MIELKKLRKARKGSSRLKDGSFRKRKENFSSFGEIAGRSCGRLL